MSKKKKKKTWLGTFLLCFIAIASLGVAAFSGYQYYIGEMEYRHSAEVYEELSEIVEETEEGFRPDFEALAAINSDVVAWIKLEDSTIDYPVVQGKDNSYYLEHLFDGTVKHNGTVFVDCKNTPGFVDRNTAMYAHHMRDGSMFADLEKFLDADWRESHLYFRLYTPDAEYKIYPFAGLKFKGSEAQIQMTFEDSMAFLEYVDELKSKSLFESDIRISASDQIVTLSTCTYGNNWQYNNERFAIFGKLVRIK